MSRTEIIEKLREILLAADDRNRDKVAACTEDSRLVADLGFSSVSMLYMVIAIEEEFGIDIVLVKRRDKVSAAKANYVIKEGDQVAYL